MREHFFLFYKASIILITKCDKDIIRGLGLRTLPNVFFFFLNVTVTLLVFILSYANIPHGRSFPIILPPTQTQPTIAYYSKLAIWEGGRKFLFILVHLSLSYNLCAQVPPVHGGQILPCILTGSFSGVSRLPSPYSNPLAIRDL